MRYAGGSLEDGGGDGSGKVVNALASEQDVEGCRDSGREKSTGKCTEAAEYEVPTG